MKRIAYLALALGLTLVSCQPSWESEKETFVTSCQESYISSFKNTVGSEYIDAVNLDELDKLAESQCECIFSEVQKKYDTPEEAYSQGYDKLFEDVKGCEPSEDQLNKLLK